CFMSWVINDKAQDRKVTMNEIEQIAESNGVVIYACSGCSDAGELADRAARVLSQKKLGEMSCLAGIGGRVKPLMIKAEKAQYIVAIDGCPLNCARHTLAQAGFKTIHHLELHRLGLRKGSCPPNDERLAVAVKAGTALIQTIGQNNDGKL
ncbi:MAG TPA: putative zinc-binding protein, partial [Verrucomicrobiae bacterium]|nr:putative zinc-binding protein [Verrucomicrobiae bacterium]